MPQVGKRALLLGLKASWQRGATTLCLRAGAGGWREHHAIKPSQGLCPGRGCSL